MTLPIIGGDYGTLKRLGLAARAETLALRREVEAIKRQLYSMQDSVGTHYLYSQGASLGTLIESVSVTALKTVDGRDISVDGTTLDGHTTSITEIQTFAGNSKALFIPAAAFLNRDARTDGYSNVKHYYQAIDAATSRYHSTFLVPYTITASTNLTFKLHWLVGGAGGTAGQDVVWRLSTGFTANGEVTSTSAAQVDVTVDTPTITAETFYISTLSTTVSGAVVGDNATIAIDRRGSDGADTLTAIAGFVGVEINWTPDYT